jgi:hypothetical protein
MQCFACAPAIYTNHTARACTWMGNCDVFSSLGSPAFLKTHVGNMGALTCLPLLVSFANKPRRMQGVCCIPIVAQLTRHALDPVRTPLQDARHVSELELMFLPNLTAHENIINNGCHSAEIFSL